MKIAMAQMKCCESIEENFNKTILYIRKAAKEKADLICFPEIQLSRFFPQYKNYDTSKILMDVNSKYFKEICNACKENKIMAVPNIYLKENDNTFDATFIIDNKGEVLGCQKMVHITSGENFYEQNYYTPSDDGFKVFKTEFGNIGIVVCFDRHYPESIRTSALKGADLIIIPTANVKSEPLEMFKWELSVQAFQSSVNIVMCNRTGLEDKMDFAGESIIVNENGKVLFKADDSEGLFIKEVDISNAKKIRDEKPFTSLRRKEFYY